MARSIGNSVPDSLRDVLDGVAPERWEGFTILLLTSTPEGWPHLAMLSVGEVLLTGPRSLRLALWPLSSAARNLEIADQVTLALVSEGRAYSIRCLARREPDLQIAGLGTYAQAGLDVQEVLEDAAPYAVLTSGVTYSLSDPESTLARWKATIAALRDQSQPAQGNQ